ncbi:MAG TPA: hypothetical protein VFJ82_09775 [Longimicrobium sp.]|nr:hypothetical protein [Longimicrobium sp.]
MSTIARNRYRRFYERKAIVEALAVVPPVVALAITAALNLRDPEKRGLGWVLAAAAAWLAIANLVKVLNAHAQDAEQAKKQEHPGLAGALHAVHGAISGRLGLTREDLGRLRMTIHGVVPPQRKGQSSEEIEQLLPYVGGRGSEAGRRFSIRSGITGKAVRECAPFAASRRSEDYTEFIRELVSDWAYTEDDARKLSPDRRSWMAVPIFGSRGSVAGVVYCDSNERDFFTDEVRMLIVHACDGITAYIAEVYR